VLESALVSSDVAQIGRVAQIARGFLSFHSFGIRSIKAPAQQGQGTLEEEALSASVRFVPFVTAYVAGMEYY
jgi:hypothetical protein